MVTRLDKHLKEQNNEDLVGKYFIDESDSFCILQVMGVDALVPREVLVKPINDKRCWQKNAFILRQIINEVREVTQLRSKTQDYVSRTYLYQSDKYELRANHGVDVCFFNLFKIPFSTNIPELILVNGEDSWGDDLSWDEAIQIMTKHIEEKIQ
jgi:predicted butyrate kinase (DUF1464 family)